MFSNKLLTRCHWRGGFSATKIKVAQNCLKCIDPVSKNLSHPGGGFSATKTKVAQKIFPGGAFLPQKPKLLKIV